MESFQTKLKHAKNDTKKKQKAENGEKKEPKSKVTIDQVNDIDELQKLFDASDSRGKKSRIKKKIARLQGKSTTPEAAQTPKSFKPKENGMREPGQELKRREKPLDEQKVIEKTIAKQVKKNIKRKRKQQLKSEEEVDTLLKSFEDRINKKLKKLDEAGDEEPQHNSDNDDAGFENVEVDEN